MTKIARGKYAYGFCDRTGFRYNLKDLVEEYVDGRPSGMRVGRDMVDQDHPQNFLSETAASVLPDAQALPFVRPDPSLASSRAMWSWNPAGVGNLQMQAYVGRVSIEL